MAQKQYTASFTACTQYIIKKNVEYFLYEIHGATYTIDATVTQQ